MTRFLPAFAVFSLATTAYAGIYTGCVDLGMQADRVPGDLISVIGELDAVEIHHCNGATDVYPVGDTFDFVKGFDFTIAGGDLCSATLHWSSPLYITGQDFSAIATAPTTLSLDPIVPTPIQGMELIAGDLKDPADPTLSFVY